MTHTIRTLRATGIGIAARAAILAGSVALGMSAALAQVAFDAPDKDYRGMVRAQSTEQGAPILAGSEVKLSGQNFKPGQKITILRGGEALLPDAVSADDKGAFEATITLPGDAAVGVHPLVVTTQEPYNAAIVELKVSPEVPLSGEDKFTTADNKLVQGLYQTAYSEKSDALFVTAAVGRPPVKESALLKVSPETLEIVAQATPGEAPGRGDREGGLYAVYGVAVDEDNGNVWVTNTRQNTVAVYKQDDLSLVKQFEPGLVAHARDVAVANGKAYAAPVGVPEIVVFDAKTLEEVSRIKIEANGRGQSFSPTSLQLDAESGKLFVVSMESPDVAIIDTATDAVEKVVSVKGVRSAIGVAYDGQTKRIFVAAQGSDNLVIVDAESGETLHDVPVGAGSLNVAFEPGGRLAYVSNRGSGTVTVVDPDGNIVANLDNSPLPNHVLADGKGNVFAVNKSRGADDAQGDRITRITAK